MIVQYLKLSFSSELIYRVQMALTGLTLITVVSQVHCRGQGLMSYFSGRERTEISLKTKAEFTLGSTCCDAAHIRLASVLYVIECKPYLGTTTTI